MAQTLSDKISAVIHRHLYDDGTAVDIIAIEAVERIARQMGISGKAVEMSALRDNILPDRYLRNMKTLSVPNQLTLLESTVGVVGLGGLGGLVTETLARMGVGCLHLIDGDVFESHNLNRQLLSNSDTIGQSKADAARLHIRNINPCIDVISASCFLTSENAVRLLNQCKVVVDCLDTIEARFILQAAAREIGIPMVSAAIAGLSGHVTTIYPEKAGLETIYGPQDQRQTAKGVEVQLGCIGTAVNLMASLECSETLKILLDKSDSLKNRLLMVDLADYTFEILPLS